MSEDLDPVEVIRKKIENKEIWFCPRPFDHIYNNVNGKYAVCCIGGETGAHSAEVSPMDWMNSDPMTELRYDMLSEDGVEGTPTINKLCRQCKNAEKLYGESERTRFTYSPDGRVDAHTNFILDQAVATIANGEWKPTKRCLMVQLRHFGNQCNLDCYMCHPRNSSTRTKQAEIHGWHKMLKFDPPNYDANSDFSKLNEKIIELAPYISSWSIQGGEPLIMRNQYKILNSLIESGHSKYITIEMNTNATTLASGKHRIIPYFEKFRQVNINLSIDSVGEYNEYIRRRSKWADIEENIKKLKAIRNVRMEILCTLSILSVLRFDRLLKWAKENHLKVKTVVVEIPSELHPKNLPDPIKRVLIKQFFNNQVLVGALSEKRDQKAFERAIEYCEAQDRAYNFNMDVHELFPEIQAGLI